MFDAMQHYVAPLPLPTDMGTTREIDTQENTQFRARNGLAQAYPVRFDNEAERAEWIKHSVVFLERPLDSFVQHFFDPRSPSYVAKTWSSLNHLLAQAAYETYPTASSVTRRWRYAGVTDNVTPLQGFGSHQAPKRHAVLNVVIGQYVRAFNYWLEAQDADNSLRSTTPGQYCWGVVQKDLVAPPLSDQPFRRRRRTRNDEDDDGDELRHSTDHVSLTDDTGITDMETDGDDKVSGTVSRSDDDTVSSGHSQLRPFDWDNLELFEPEIDNGVLLNLDNTPKLIPAVYMAIRDANYKFSLDKSVISRCQMIQLPLLHVVSGKHVYRDKKDGTITRKQHALYPVLPSMRDVAMAMLHGWKPGAGIRVIKQDRSGKFTGLDSSAAALQWLKTEHFKSTTPCGLCTGEEKLDDDTRIQHMRQTTDRLLIERYVSEFTSLLQQTRKSTETWFMFPSFVMIVDDTQSPAVRFVHVNKETTPMPGSVPSDSTEEMARQAYDWMYIVTQSDLIRGWKRERGYYPVVLWPFWEAERPTSLNDLEVHFIMNQWRTIHRERYHIASTPDITPSEQSEIEVERLGELFEYLKSNPESKSITPVSRVSGPLAMPELAKKVQDLQTALQYIDEHAEGVIPEWYQQGYRWQVLPAVTNRPEPPVSSSSEDTECIFMGRCVFLCGVVAHEPGLCRSFVQPLDPRHSAAKLAAKMNQLDLVVGQDP